MSVPVEAIQGFLLRAGLKFAMNDQGGTNGQFLLSFRTKNYVNQEGKKSLSLMVSVAEDGRYLEIAAVNLYSATKAKDVGKLCEFLMGQNYNTKLMRWEIDRTDNEIRATVEAAPLDGSITFHAFMRMLMMVPTVADSLHSTITKVMTTAKLPRATRTNKRLQDLVRRAGGIEALERLVRKQEKTHRQSLELDPDVAAKFGLDVSAEGKLEDAISSDMSDARDRGAAESIDLVDEITHDESDHDRPDDDGPCECEHPCDGE